MKTWIAWLELVAASTLVGCIGGPEELYEMEEAELAAEAADEDALARPVQPAPLLLPDIAVSNASVPGNPVYGCGNQMMVVQVTEQNLGGDTMPSYWLQLRRGPTPVRGIQVPALAPNAGRTTTYGFSFYGGPCDCFPGQWTESYQLVADPGNQVAELSETNNTTSSFLVRRRCP